MITEAEFIKRTIELPLFIKILFLIMFLIIYEGLKIALMVAYCRLRIWINEMTIEAIRRGKK